MILKREWQADYRYLGRNRFLREGMRQKACRIAAIRCEIREWHSLMDEWANMVSAR